MGDPHNSQSEIPGLENEDLGATGDNENIGHNVEVIDNPPSPPPPDYDQAMLSAQIEESLSIVPRQETGEKEIRRSRNDDEKGILKAVFDGVEAVRIVQSRQPVSDGWWLLSGLFETYNIFTVTNASSGTPILKAEEHTGWYTGMMMGFVRPFSITFQDAQTGRDVFTMKSALSTPCNWVQVYSSDGKELFGSVSAASAESRIVVRSVEGHLVTEIEGGSGLFNCGRSNARKILPPYGGGSGRGDGMGTVEIVRAESGSGSLVMNATFPPGFKDPRIKAVLLAGVFLIDFMFYEKACN